MSSRDERYRVSIRVEEATADIFLGNRITNISRGGIFIEGARPLPIGSEVDLSFTLPESEQTIQARGRVVWSYDLKQGTSHLVLGSGIKFTAIAPQNRLLLEDSLDRLRNSDARRGVATGTQKASDAVPPSTSQGLGPDWSEDFTVAR